MVNYQTLCPFGIRARARKKRRRNQGGKSVKGAVGVNCLQSDSLRQLVKRDKQIQSLPFSSPGGDLL